MAANFDDYLAKLPEKEREAIKARGAELIEEEALARGVKEPFPPPAGLYILDDDGEPVPAPSLEAWARLFEDGERRSLRRTVMDGDIPERCVEISTVFLGLDHGFSRIKGAPPVLWETMIFGGPQDQYCERYTSKADALAGHQRVCVLAWSQTPGRG